MLIIVSNNRVISKNNKIVYIDNPVQDFLNATQINNPTIISALNYLVDNLKLYNLWDKMKAIYPFVGGTATAHKFNLKDPRDLDAAYRLTFSGGLTHSSNGCLPNGSSGAGNSYITCQTIGIDNIHMSYYSRSNINTERGDMGTTTSPYYSLWIRYNGTVCSDCYAPNWSPPHRISITNANSLGYYITTRPAINSHSLYKNGIKIVSTTGTRTILPATGTIRLFVTGSTGSGYYSDKQCAFATIGYGLSDTDALNLYNIVQQFQTILGRQV